MSIFSQDPYSDSSLCNFVLLQGFTPRHCRVPVIPGLSVVYSLELKDNSFETSAWDNMTDQLAITNLVFTDAPQTAPETANFLSVAVGLLIVSLFSLARMHRSRSDGTNADASADSNLRIAI